jgi:hypothetical protein
MDVAVPDWVVPERQEVIDCHRLTVNTEDPYRRGVSGALRWVLGPAPGPLVAGVGTSTADRPAPAAAAHRGGAVRGGGRR